MTQRRHIVLVTYGEPQRPGFVGQLTYSWRILLGLTRTIASIPKPALPMIALSRAFGRRKLWTAESYESPLESITRQQADALGRALAAADPACDWRLHVGYEFRHPLLSEVLATIPVEEPALVVPMYAADSGFTHGLSRGVVLNLAHARSTAAPIRVLPAIETAALAAASAAYIRARTTTRPGWTGSKVALVLAAHGTLVAPSRPIDTGLAATQALCDAIREELTPEFGLIVNGWLNHSRGGKWTEPAMDEALRQVEAAGFQRVVYFPYGFVADNAESQLEGRLFLRARPALESWHLPCLNDDPRLIETFVEQIVGTRPKAAPPPGHPLCDDTPDVEGPARDLLRITG